MNMGAKVAKVVGKTPQLNMMKIRLTVLHFMRLFTVSLKLRDTLKLLPLESIDSVELNIASSWK